MLVALRSPSQRDLKCLHIRGVGKTSLLVRFADGNFLTEHITTIGIDFRQKIIERNGKPVRVQVWDTAGQERFSSILPPYYKNAQGVALCFDPTDETSFQRIGTWLAKISEYAQGTLQMSLVATKGDVFPRAVSDEVARAFATKNKASYFVTSARTGAGVDEMFAELTERAVDVAQAFAANAPKVHNEEERLATATPTPTPTSTCCPPALKECACCPSPPKCVIL
jgi:small GTP-binding protein